MTGSETGGCLTVKHPPRATTLDPSTQSFPTFPLVVKTSLLASGLGVICKYLLPAAKEVKRLFRVVKAL